MVFDLEIYIYKFNEQITAVIFQNCIIFLFSPREEVATILILVGVLKPEAT